MQPILVVAVVCLGLAAALIWSLVKLGSLKGQLATAAAQGARASEAEQSRATLSAERDRLARELADLRTDTARESSRLVTEAEALRKSLEEAQQARETAVQATKVADAELARCTETLAVVTAKKEALEATCAEHARARTQQEARLDELNRQLAVLNADVAKAQAECHAARQRCEETEAFLKSAQEKMNATFREAASKVFDEKAIALERRIQAAGEMNKQGLDATLKPFAEKVGTLQQRLDQVNAEQSRDRAELRGKIDELASLNRGMADTTTALTRALKGNAKVRGDWGELMLDTVLKSSGLVEGLNYDKQESARDEDGSMHRPDVLIRLPDERKVIIDAKVNLVAWAKYVEAETAEDMQASQLEHTAALRRHVLDLAAKNYPKQFGGSALETTVMFVPIEGALAAALATDPSLQEEAMQKGIALASPNTLMAMLRLVDRIWARERITRDVDAIRKLAQDLVDSVVLFKERFDKAGDALKKAHDQHEAAARSLDAGTQSIYRRSQRLAEIAGKGKKDLPEELKSGSDSQELGVLGEALMEVGSDLAAGTSA